MRKIQNVAIIGAGVIGTTCAIKLKEQFGDAVKITIFSEDFSPNTTGDLSAGVWGPFIIGNTPRDKILKWSKSTHDYLHRLWKSGDAQAAGICLIPVTRAVTGPTEYDAFWKNNVFGFVALNKKQIERLQTECKSNWTVAVNFVSFTCEPKFLLPYLYKQFIDNGGHFQRKRIKSFEELHEYDLIINCAGLGARSIVDDDELMPIRGQIMRVKAPWIFDVIVVDDDDANYIIPNMETVVLGGTHQSNDYNTSVNADDTKFIYNGCMRMAPSVQRAKIVEEYVGLRPGRCTVRLERDTFLTKDGKMLPIIHNYGHGGCGVTLSWGCAIEVADIVESMMRPEHEQNTCGIKCKL